MRLLTFVILMTLSSIVAAQESFCNIDISGTQRTESHAQYTPTPEATALARTALDFANAATNHFFFTRNGATLLNSLVGPGGLRVRPTPVYFRSCNDIGQCATVSIYSQPAVLPVFNLPLIHAGFRISATLGTTTSSVFYDAMSNIPYSFLNKQAAADKTCRDNQGRPTAPPTPPDPSSDYEDCMAHGGNERLCAEYRDGDDGEDDQSDRRSDWDSDCYDNPKCDEEDSYGGPIRRPRTFTEVCFPVGNGEWICY
ncbi:MAG: hypothetical protein AAF270_06050 [Pseudomonadota bacterium]